MAEVSASVVAERILGLAASSVMSCVALAVAIRTALPLAFLLPWALLAIGAGVAAIILPLNPTVGRLVQRWQARLPGHQPLCFLRRVGSAYTAYRRHAGLLALVAVLSVCEQWFPLALMWTVGQALGMPLTVSMVVVTMPLTLFVGRLPISLGGLGVGDGAIVVLLGLFDISVDEAVAVSVLCRAVDLAVTAVPGIVLWRDLVEPLRAARRERNATA